MLNWNPTNTPLLSPRKKVFTRGKYEYKSLKEVHAENPDYLVFLVIQGNIDKASWEIIEAYARKHGLIEGNRNDNK